MEIIMPCPFCGDSDCGLAPISDRDGNVIEYAGECPTCAGYGPPAPTKEQAIKLWNNRK